MPQAELDQYFSRVHRLKSEFSEFAPADEFRKNELRSDLAGFLVVAMATSYENCVKETLITYATRHHSAFGNFASKNYEKLNSRVSRSDLQRYAAVFDDGIGERFKIILRQRKQRIEVRTGRSIEAAYDQILAWRHAFAHAGARNTTIEEAWSAHRLARHVLYVFDRAFNGA